MDRKVTLSKEQLKELKEYIISRGILEPVVVMEVLDHFACLVEERMAENDKLTLRDAMYEAHNSFGVMGFSRIAETARRDQQKFFRRLMKTHLKKMFKKPLNWGVMILGMLAYYKLYIITFPFDWFFMNGKYLIDATYIIGMSSYFIITRKYWPKKGSMSNNNHAGYSDGGYGWLLFVLIMAFPNYPGRGLPLWPFALSASVMSCFLVLYFVANYRALLQAVKHYQHVEDAYMSLSD